MKSILKRLEIPVLAGLRWRDSSRVSDVEPKSGSHEDCSVRLPVQDVAVRVTGKGERALSVFEHPECSFCIKLAPRLAALKDLTLRRYVPPGHSVTSRKAATASVYKAQSGGPLAYDCAVGAAVIDINLALARSLASASCEASSA